MKNVERVTGNFPDTTNTMFNTYNEEYEDYKTVSAHKDNRIYTKYYLDNKLVGRKISTYNDGSIDVILNRYV